MTIRRDLLPQRRRNETFEITFGGQNTVFSITVGFYDDDRVGEVFIDGAKAGSEMDAIAGDGAVLISMALQHGVPLKTIQRAVARWLSDEPRTIVGAVIDRIVEMYDANP